MEYVWERDCVPRFFLAWERTIARAQVRLPPRHVTVVVHLLGEVSLGTSCAARRYSAGVVFKALLWAVTRSQTSLGVRARFRSEEVRHAPSSTCSRELSCA